MIGLVGVVRGSSFAFPLPRSFEGEGIEERLRALRVKSFAIPIRVRGEEGRDAREKSALRRSGAEEVREGEEVEVEVQR